MLQRLGAIRNENVEVFSIGTRDRKDLPVYRDKISKVIFNDEYYVGDEECHSGKYRHKPESPIRTIGRDHEDLADIERRY